MGQTIDRLQESGLWEDALVVVVADHGGSFIVDQPGRALSSGTPTRSCGRRCSSGTRRWPPGSTTTDIEATDLLPTMADLLGIELPYAVDGASAVSHPDTSGTKRYQRLQNPFQPEPDALLNIDTAGNYRRLLSDLWPTVDVDDPVGSFYRQYPSVTSTAVTWPSSSGPGGGSAELDQLDAIQEGGDEAQPAYLGGQVDLDGIDPDDAWVVVAVDGVVQGFSRLFAMLDADTAFSILVDQDVVGGEPTTSTSTSSPPPPAPSTPSPSRDPGPTPFWRLVRRPGPDRNGRQNGRHAAVSHFGAGEDAAAYEPLAGGACRRRGSSGGRRRRMRRWWPRSTGRG